MPIRLAAFGEARLLVHGTVRDVYPRMIVHWRDPAQPLIGGWPTKGRRNPPHRAAHRAAPGAVFDIVWAMTLRRRSSGVVASRRTAIRHCCGLRLARRSIPSVFSSSAQHRTPHWCSDVKVIWPGQGRAVDSRRWRRPRRSCPRRPRTHDRGSRRTETTMKWGQGRRSCSPSAPTGTAPARHRRRNSPRTPGPIRRKSAQSQCR